jgi:hypothetical protein
MLKKTDKKELDEALTKISDVACLIECLATEYREKFDELSEKAQEGERGTKLDETHPILGSCMVILPMRRRVAIPSRMASL